LAHSSRGGRDEQENYRSFAVFLALFDEGPEMRLSEAVYCVCVSDPGKTNACARHDKSASPSKAEIEAERAKLQRIGEERARHEQGFPVAGHDRSVNCFISRDR
jgi:hypothetical protein